MLKRVEVTAETSTKIAEQTQTELAQIKQQELQTVAEGNFQASTTLTTKQNSIKDVVNKWRPVITYVLCGYKDIYGNVQAQSGSGTLLLNKNKTHSILTNYHVVSDDTGNIVGACVLKLPDDKTIYTVKGNNITTTPDTSDVAFINIVNPDIYLKKMASESINYCKQIPSVGEEIVILGYPGVGSPTDITATDGIISGYDGNYYVTSAKVGEGNSGGAAIDVANNCYLGIPTYVETDSADSLARVLKWQAF